MDDLKTGGSLSQHTQISSIQNTYDVIRKGLARFVSIVGAVEIVAQNNERMAIPGFVKLLKMNELMKYKKSE